MNKKILFAFFLLTSFFSQAQNLVPNPSFEDTISCPTTANQLDKAVGWHSGRESPDYFNQCDFVLTGTTSIPSNFVGFQYPHSGNAYSGFVTFDRSSPNYREAITCQLISPLQIGHSYLISFYISLAGGFATSIASNKIGVLFSTNNFTYLSPCSISNQASCFSDTIVVDTLSWVKNSYKFISDSNYTYLSIANFNTDAQTDTVQLMHSTTAAYYYIDDINVIEDKSLEASNLHSKINFKIFPNPSSGKLIINSSENLITKIYVFNQLGKLEKIIVNDLEQNQFECFIDDLSCGNFLLKIIFKNNQECIYKHIKN